MKNHYNSKFYLEMLEGSKRSAEKILPIVFSEIKPQSVVDVGCGTGAWLFVAKTLNVKDVLGVDGYYAKDHLLIQPNEFKSIDISKGFTLNRRYDLAICLEVGEHISNTKSSVLVNSLTRAADVILFSAAQPGQGGKHHVNEQWPEFWEELFRKKDYVRIDYIRPLIYNDPDIKWWYRQNILIYVHLKELKKYPRLEVMRNQNNDILLIQRSLLKRKYGLLRAILYYIKYPIVKVLIKFGILRVE